ncbi:MAG: VWA domain-containing protein [Polyangiaceae bacterium]|nr:VWA domain-containing protein [Polyangiaceae bacterium]
MLLSRKHLFWTGLGALLCACAVGGKGLPTGGGSGGGSGESGGTGSGSGDTGGNTTSTGGGSASPTDGGKLPPGLKDTGTEEDTGLFEGEDACAATTQGSHITQVNLVFIYDKSGSMGDDTNTEAEGYPRWQNMDVRWNPAKEAMTTFFLNPGAPELYASLKFFPANGDYDTTCSVAKYEKPDVALTPLSNPDPLISALERTTPGGGTPTLPALMGSINYANKLMTDYPGSKSIVIMVTDGEPVVVDSTGAERTDNCPEGNDNNIDNIAAVAQAAYNRPEDERIPTYVIGIGEALDNLGAIASAGGTNLILIEGSSGEDTKARLLEALQGIQVESIDCDMSIPVPEAGEVLDFTKVNFNFVHSDGTVEQLGRNDACSSAGGWHYDNPSAPTKIMLCESTCTAVQNDVKGYLEVELGCDTRVILK